VDHVVKEMPTCLKPILPFFISKEQAGYMEGRKILDNIILSHEVIHSLKMTKIPGMLIKTDLSKSFDRISWHYMRSMLESFGFERH
jgi:hypothetical protein